MHSSNPFQTNNEIECSNAIKAIGNLGHSESSSIQTKMISPSNTIVFLINDNYLPDNFQIKIINSKEANENQFKRRRSNKSKFSEEEDKKLCDLVLKYGENNWKIIANEMDGRSIRQCRDRYRHYLSPNINKNEWTNEEDELLLKEVRNIGFKWKKLENFFADRNEIQIRNRYYQITHSSNRNISNDKNFIDDEIKKFDSNDETLKYFEDSDFELKDDFCIDADDYFPSLYDL